MIAKRQTRKCVLSTPLDRKVIQLCRDKGVITIKDVDLMNLISGNNMTAQERASRRLASLKKRGFLTRKKICLEASEHDGTKWLYAYEAV